MKLDKKWIWTCHQLKARWGKWKTNMHIWLYKLFHDALIRRRWRWKQWCAMQRKSGVQSQSRLQSCVFWFGLMSFNHLNVDFFICAAEIGKCSKKIIKWYIWNILSRCVYRRVLGCVIKGTAKHDAKLLCVDFASENV